MEVAKAVWHYDLWNDLKEAQEKATLSEKERELWDCQYPKLHKKRFHCGDCLDLLTCKCSEAKQFKNAHKRTKVVEYINHSAFIQFYDQKKAIEKLSRYLTYLKIKRFRRKVSIFFARIKKIYFIPFVHKINSKICRFIKKRIMRDVYVY